MRKSVYVMLLLTLCLSAHSQENPETILTRKIDSLINLIDTNDVNFEENAGKLFGDFTTDMVNANIYDTLDIVGSIDAERIENEIQMLNNEDQDFDLNYSDSTFLFIDLSDLNNQDLLEDVNKFQNLKVLVINGNSGSETLDIMSLLSRLQGTSIRELHILNCKGGVNSIPDNIGNLKTIQKLGLYGNELISLPESVSELTLLEVLYLDLNPITSLPVGIDNLTNLKELGIAQTKIDNAELIRIKKLIPQCKILIQ